jgi:hypothetical protein
MARVMMRSLLIAVVMTGCSSASPPPATPTPAAAPPPSVAPPLEPIETSLSPRAGSGSATERDDETGIYGGVTTDEGRDNDQARSPDPFTRQLSDDIHRAWQAPSTTGNAIPVGCIHLKPDGTIALTKLKESSGDAAFDDSVQHALDVVKAERNAHPLPVPTHLLAMTTKWVCVRFDPNKL